MTPKKLAFVDIETTGARVTSDRIIEIAVLRLEDNKLVKTYQTLVNPQTHVPPFIENYTGITKAELENAPTFPQVCRELLEALDDCVFVAHNVRFDYGFLKNEFYRCGVTFTAPQLCTVKLSRKLYPEHRRHSIDSLVERFGFNCPNRHRAYDDAKVMVDFYLHVQNQFAPEVIESALKYGLRRPSIPPALDPQTVYTLPETPGVYIFYGHEGYPLYVGKSKNIRERVLSHFCNDYTSSKEMAMCQQVESIEHIPTAGELGALLKESALVKELQPLYNRKLRQSRRLLVLKKETNKAGYETAHLETVDTIAPEEVSSIIGVFRSARQAKEMLVEIAKEHKLCQKLLHLEKSSGSCFGYQIESCHGACVGEELPIKYNLRFIEAFHRKRFRPWPFSGPIMIKEENPLTEQAEGFVLNNWCFVGTYRAEDGTVSDLSSEDYTFDLDTYKILVSHIFSKKNPPNIQVLKETHLSLIQ